MHIRNRLHLICQKIYMYVCVYARVFVSMHACARVCVLYCCTHDSDCAVILMMVSQAETILIVNTIVSYICMHTLQNKYFLPAFLP